MKICVPLRGIFSSPTTRIFAPQKKMSDFDHRRANLCGTAPEGLKIDPMTASVPQMIVLAPHKKPMKP
jgi:hypothetical protein